MSFGTLSARGRGALVSIDRRARLNLREFHPFVAQPHFSLFRIELFLMLKNKAFTEQFRFGKNTGTK